LKRSQSGATSRLVLEYESVAKRELAGSILSAEEIDAIVDMICKRSSECDVSFRWRPYLNDPDDDFILALAVASASEYLVTYNKSDFRGADQFGINVVTPKEFLEILGEFKS
jgi:predicted nucleic acid-binding protein